MAAVVGPSAAAVAAAVAAAAAAARICLNPERNWVATTAVWEGWRMCWWWPNATQKVFCSPSSPLSPSCSRSLVVLFSGSTAAHFVDPLLPGMGFAEA